MAASGELEQARLLRHSQNDAESTLANEGMASLILLAGGGTPASSPQKNSNCFSCARLGCRISVCFAGIMLSVLKVFHRTYFDIPLEREVPKWILSQSSAEEIIRNFCRIGRQTCRKLLLTEI